MLYYLSNVFKVSLETHTHTHTHTAIHSNITDLSTIFGLFFCHACWRPQTVILFYSSSLWEVFLLENGILSAFVWWCHYHGDLMYVGLNSLVINSQPNVSEVLDGHVFILCFSCIWPEKSEPWHWLGLWRILYTSYLLFSSPPSTFAASGCAYQHHPYVHYNEPRAHARTETSVSLFPSLSLWDSICIVSRDYCHMLLVSLTEDADRSTVLCCCLALLLLASLQFLHNSVLMVPTLCLVWFQKLCQSWTIIHPQGIAFVE